MIEHSARYRVRAVAIADLFDYTEPFYDRKRCHSALGYVSPARFLENRVGAQHEQQMAA